MMNAAATPRVSRYVHQATGPDARRPSASRPASLVETDLACDLVLVGGVPGAGKTTAIARATNGLHWVRAVDPEHIMLWLRRRLPDRAPYQAYRWLVHLLHTLSVLAHLLSGPRTGRRLVVHDPGTRARRRSLFLALARLAGWRPVLLYVDVDRGTARDGQRRRGRVVRSFSEHWDSWQRLRITLVAEASTDESRPAVRAEPVLLVDRARAAKLLRGLCLAGLPGENVPRTALSRMQCR